MMCDNHVFQVALWQTEEEEKGRSGESANVPTLSRTRSNPPRVPTTETACPFAKTEQHAAMSGTEIAASSILAANGEWY